GLGDAEGLIVAVDGGPVGGRPAAPRDAHAAHDGGDDPFAQGEGGGDGACGLGWDVVAAVASGLGDKGVAAEFAQVVGGLADGVIGVAGDGVDLVREVGDGEAVGGG